MPWLTFHMLHSRLLYQTKVGLEHCRGIIESQVKFDEDEEGGGLDDSLEGGEVGGKEEQEQGCDHPQEPLSPRSKDAARQEEPSALPVPVQKPKKVTFDSVGSVTEPETKDDINAGGGAVLSEELAASLDGQQVLPAVISADKEEAASSSFDSESRDHSMPETAEAEVEVGEAEEVAEEEEEDGFQSWIEEPDEEDQDRARVATGDGDLGNIMDIEDEQEGVEGEEEEEEEEEDERAEGFDQIKDWGQTVGDGEADEVGNTDFETEERQQQQRQTGGYDYEKDPYSFQLGSWTTTRMARVLMIKMMISFPEYYTLRQRQQKHWYRDSRQKQRQRYHGGPGGGRSGRWLSQQMQMDVEGAALPFYLPAPERLIDRKADTELRFKKRSMLTESPPLDPSQLEKRQLPGQCAFQQQQQQPQQQHEPILPTTRTPTPSSA